ncbi:MAG: hypothetical protein PF495_16560 [Spirochaetales bacterium]|jgi:hypothetical protein|nr:hypothetical protein [Spirochaetales bacterium]
MQTKWNRFMIATLLAITFLVPGVVSANANDLAKQADKIIRSAERKMHSGKVEEAVTMLKEAGALLEQGKSEDPSNTKISQTEKKLDRIQKIIDKKLGKTSKSAEPAMVAKQAGTTKLPGGVTKRLKDITRNLDKAERYANSDAKNAAAKLEAAKELFAEIDSKYSGQFDAAHPDYVAVKSRYNTLASQTAAQGSAEAKAESDAAGAKVAKEKQSAEWVPKFQAYLAYTGSEGHNPAKTIFVPGTSEPEKFAEAKKRYEAFKKFYEEYKKTDFPNGKTRALEDLADNQAPTRMKDFEEGFASRMGSVSERAEGGITSAMAYLEKDNGWKSDTSIRPNLLDHKRMASIKETIEQAVTALGADDPKAKQVQANFDALVAKDKENRQVRKERTFMTPDVYTGKDIKALKKKAEALVENNAKEGGKPLRCNVIAENWREETVEEWTDTSQTTLRWRTTRHQTAQVAAKTSNGVQLLTVALAQDRQSDGKWGTLYGNLHQGSDPILESNVNK